MKKSMAFLLIGTMVFSLTACGDTKTKSDNNQTYISDTDEKESQAPVTEMEESNSEGILADISADFANVINLLEEELKATNTQIGETYEDYVRNKQLLTEWYALVQSESQLLFDRTRENSIKYFKLIASEKENVDALDNAMDDFYDNIYDDAFDDYYDAVYDDLMDAVYDSYYDGIVKAGYDSASYKEWSAESSACYKEWSDASSTVYKNWSGASSETYKLWSAVSSGFYRKNFDIDSIVKELEAKPAESQNPESSEPVEDTDKQDTDTNEAELNPELVAFLDEYEAFTDEYVEFMVAYKNAKDVSAMLSDYTEIMGEYADFAKALEQYKPEEMSTADAAYLLEVSARISQKMLEVAY